MLPIRAIRHRLYSTSTVHSSSNSARTASGNSGAPPEVSVLSSVSDTLISDVVMRSTEILCLARISNTLARKP
ncbi:Uncharacterised protein [Vibrio cholerae]|nr:Uncharacterised protein [Vibrio cholerae]CSE01227.1 Uncharacterised protein [Vibrio cholerae]CSI68689.1 Uncharacterised protein [Vibrio cholerae]